MDLIVKFVLKCKHNVKLNLCVSHFSTLTPNFNRLILVNFQGKNVNAITPEFGDVPRGPRTPGFAYELDQKLDYKDPAFTGILALMQDTQDRHGESDSDSNIDHTTPTNKEE